MFFLALAFLGFLIGLVVFGFFFHKKQLAKAFEHAQVDSKKVLETARKEADQVVKVALREAKEEARKTRLQFEDESRQRRSEITKLEQKLKSREESVDKKLAIIEKRELEIELTSKKLHAEEQMYHKMTQDCEVTLENSRKMLQTVANMSQEEAKRELVKSLELQARKEAQTVIRRIEEEAKVEAESKAKAIVSLAVQRIAGEYVGGATITVVALPGEDMKGRIIGREGRNIRAIEQATGVDIIIDDTPEAVIVSCFNPLRREIAKVTIERLIADGRIHPARIEETAKRVESEFESIMQEVGEQASLDTGVTDLHPELIKLLGKLKYRTVGQQTVLQHAVETAYICGILANEIGFNIKKAKRSGLLHDIGKAVDQEIEGHHTVVGAELCQKYGEAADVVEAVRGHHREDLVDASPLTVILSAANNLSGSRPGARKETLETYVRRLADMEKIVKSFDGISEAYVMQAGREVHAIVNPLTIFDRDMVDLSSQIATKLRQELTFPGQVRVTVLRENRSIDFAK